MDGAYIDDEYGDAGIVYNGSNYTSHVHHFVQKHFRLDILINDFCFLFVTFFYVSFFFYGFFVCLNF